MRTKIVRFFCLFSACSLLLYGQAISTSQIKGTVQDASGSAVPGAEVKVTQTATGFSRTTTAGSDGSYLFSELPIGPYQIEVTKQGFSKYVQTGVTLQVNSNPTIDVALKIGAVTEQVVVEASAAMVETENAGVGQVIDQQRVADLPLNGRQVTDLLYLTGGTSQGRSFRGSYPTQASPSIAGGMAGSVSYWLDGGTHNDPLSNQNLPLPFPDALQEFKVETSSLPAQYGVHPAGAVNAITKSGGNAFHGDLFEFVRNFVFDARTTGYANPTNPRDNLKRNQFGGTVGGPIKKDKLFFFLGWQDTIERSSTPATITNLPTPAMLQGNFNGCGTLNAKTGTNNQVPISSLNPIALKIAATLPVLSNASCGTYNYLSPTNYTENQGIMKIDYHLSDRNTLFGRYFITHLEQQPGPANANFILGVVPGASDQVQTVTLGDTFLITPRTVNSFRATFNRSSNTTINNSLYDWTDVGVNNIYQLDPAKFGKGLGGLSINGGPFGTGITPSWQPYDTHGVLRRPEHDPRQASNDVRRGLHQSSGVCHQLPKLERRVCLRWQPNRLRSSRLSTGKARHLHPVRSGLFGPAPECARDIRARRMEGHSQVYSQCRSSLGPVLCAHQSIRAECQFLAVQLRAQYFQQEVSQRASWIRLQRRSERPQRQLLHGQQAQQLVAARGFSLGPPGRWPHDDSRRIWIVLRVPEFLVRSVRLRRTLRRFGDSTGPEIQRPVVDLSGRQSVPGPRWNRLQFHIPAVSAGVRLPAARQSNHYLSVQPHHSKAAWSELAAVGKLRRQPAAPPVDQRGSESWSLQSGGLPGLLLLCPNHQSAPHIQSDQSAICAILRRDNLAE